MTTLGFALVDADVAAAAAVGARRRASTPGRPIVVRPRRSTPGSAYYYFALVVLVLIASLLARNVRRSGLGRLLVAVRDNEDDARAFTVPAPAW